MSKKYKRVQPRRGGLPGLSQDLFSRSHKNSLPQRTIICAEVRNNLKRCGNSRKRNNLSRSTRRSEVSLSRESESQEDSSNSSGSSSDLHSTSRNKNRGILSRLLCRSFLALYLKLDESSVHSKVLDSWDKAGQKIIVLKGYNHKHLQYLAKEVRHIAVESNTLYRTTGQARTMLVLTAFGREEDMEEAFDDLCYLH